jgi:hypothetical protein
MQGRDVVDLVVRHVLVQLRARITNNPSNKRDAV